jgi:hypothetical protein
MSHPFEVGKTYRNRNGEYIVQAIDGERMTIRYVSGGTLETSVGIQARIWENIHFEEQMVRAEEKRRLAREARMEARKRTARAKKAKARPKFDGFQESDFEPKKRGIAWSSRTEAGKALAYELGKRLTADFGSWIVPRKSQVQVARKDYYDRDTRATNAAFHVAVNEKGVTFGLRLGKPDGKEKEKWPWSAFVAALGGDQKLRKALREAMKTKELTLDVYAEEVSYGQVGQVVVQARGFQWQHETAEQEMTRKMNWDELADYLQTVAPQKRCDLYLRKRLAVEAALGLGKDATAEMVNVFEALAPVYDTVVGA